MAVAFSSRIRTAPDVLFRLVSEEAVLVNLKTEVYLGLNPVGARIWSVLSNASTVQAGYETLLEEYDVDPVRLRSDIEEFLDELLGQRLIETGPASAEAAR